MAISDIKPLDLQILDLAEDLNPGDTSFRTIGRFEASSESTDAAKYGTAIGKQFLAFSPFTANAELTFVEIATEPTLVEGTTNTYEYSIANGELTTFVRGVDTDDDVIPPTDNSEREKKHNGQQSKVAMTVGRGLFVNLINAFTTAAEASLVKYAQVQLFDKTANFAVVDGRAYFIVPAGYNSHDLTDVKLFITGAAGETGTTDVQIHNVTDAVDMLSTKLTVDSGETSSLTAATPVVIDTANDDVATNDVLRVDIDAVSTTAPKGGVLLLEFTKIT